MRCESVHLVALVGSPARKITVAYHQQISAMATTTVEMAQMRRLASVRNVLMVTSSAPMERQPVYPLGGSVISETTVLMVQMRIPQLVVCNFWRSPLADFFPCANQDILWCKTNPFCVYCITSSFTFASVIAFYCVYSVYRNCSEVEFRCANKKCIRNDQRCDGIDNCRDGGKGSDERNCRKYETKQIIILLASSCPK